MKTRSVRIKRKFLPIKKGQIIYEHMIQHREKSKRQKEVEQRKL